jgi:alpha-maltose-1-phosphate synthase
MSPGDDTTTGRGVLISHPVHQHSYETAVAAQEAGLLRCFVTGLYFTGRGVTGKQALDWLPSAARRRLERELRRRWHPELARSRVTTIPYYHAMSTTFRWSTRRVPWLRDLDVDTWAHERFDLAVSHRLAQFGPLAAVHAFEGSALATFGAARRKGIRTILDVPSAHERFVTKEDGGAGGAGSPRIPRERRLADYLFAPSDFVVDCLQEGGVASEKIFKIPYAVDASRFRPVPRCRSEGPFRALFVGQIGPRKGVQHLLEAWRRLALPNAELVLVGDVNHYGRELLKRYAGVGRWVGAMPKYEVHRWFSASDIFVFPSLAEGSALVTYEAMAAGLPLVTTPNSGSVIRDGVDGFLVPPESVESLAHRIEHLYDNPDLRRQLGRNGRAHILSLYTWAHYRSRIARAYRSILADRPDTYSDDPRVDKVDTHPKDPSTDIGLT